MDQLFGTFPGVQNYCNGGNSPQRCSNNQSMSCTTVGTHDVCGNGGWCEPIVCTTPTGPECSAGDTCPQITVGRQTDGSDFPLLRQNATSAYENPLHTQAAFISELANGAMKWSPTSGGLAYLDSKDIPYYYLLAGTYGLADNHFSMMGGPSAPNHAYLFAASSNEMSDNPKTTQAGTSTNPGLIAGFASPWTCGAQHSGSGVPYTYLGSFPSTQASDGTRYFGGVCTNHHTTACTCKCPTGTKCPNSFDPTNGGTACSTDVTCTELSDTCSTQMSIGGTAGAPCMVITTIADRIEAALGSGPNSWAYYSHNSQWNAASYFQNLYFDNSRWKAHVYDDVDFDPAANACTGMCSNNHSKACAIDSQCGGGSCIDSDGTPPGSQACALPKVVYLSATDVANSEHPPQPMQSGENWTKTRLANVFASPYVYYHSIVLLTWDDWGGYYDHVPPPVQDSVPTLGFRVPLLCIGPYCRNQVIHTQLEFASELKCIETVFGVPAINSRDAGATDACAGTGTLANNKDGMVNLSQSPIPAIGQSLNPTTTSVQSSPNPSIYDQPVTFTANVASTSGTPAGTVTFTDSGTEIGSSSLSGGSASISPSNLLGGTHSTTASYAGDEIFAASVSPALSQVVNPSASTTTLQSSQNPAGKGKPVTFTATVSGSGVTPTGQVTFSDGATTLGTSTISNGQATLTTSSLSIGTHSISANYLGNSNYLASTSAVLVETIANGPSTTTLNSSLNPSVYAQSVTFTANVSGAGGTPTGSVTFNSGASVLGTSQLAGGTATLAYSAFTAGPHVLTASYSGDSNFQPSTSAPLTQTVSQASSTTALASSQNPSFANQMVTFTATVTSQYGGAVSGNVTFKQGTTVLSTVLVVNGQATYATAIAAAGTSSITATYSGDTNNLGSTSAPLMQTVGQASSSTALASSQNPSYASQSVTFTATVTSQYGGAVTGNVVFRQGTTALGTASLVNGQASYTTAFTAAGTFSITATYSGDANNLTSTSVALSQVVKALPAATTTALATSGTPSFVGNPVTFTATVTSTYGPIPNGDLVTFLDGSNTLASEPLSGGIATYTTSALTVTSHAIHATFVGNATFKTSTTSLTQVVNLDPSATALSSSLNPSNSGELVTFTATVTSTDGPIPDGELVRFYNGTAQLAAVPLTGGVATYATSSLTVATHTIKATYAGDTTFASSTGSLSQVVVNP